MRIDFSQTQYRADDLQRWSRLRRAGRAIGAALFVTALIVVVFKTPPQVDGQAEREVAVAKHVRR